MYMSLSFNKIRNSIKCLWQYVKYNIKNNFQKMSRQFD